jgi:hypothetical protein
MPVTAVSNARDVNSFADWSWACTEKATGVTSSATTWFGR